MGLVTHEQQDRQLLHQPKTMGVGVVGQLEVLKHGRESIAQFRM